MADGSNLHPGNRASIRLITADHSALTTELERILDIDFDKLSEDSEEIFAVSTKIKSTLCRYKIVSRKLSKRLVEEGYLNEAQEIRTSRVDLQKDCKETIASLNNVLFKLGLSNMSDIASDITASTAKSTASSTVEQDSNHPDDSHYEDSLQIHTDVSRLVIGNNSSHLKSAFSAQISDNVPCSNSNSNAQSINLSVKPKNLALLDGDVGNFSHSAKISESQFNARSDKKVAFDRVMNDKLDVNASAYARNPQFFPGFHTSTSRSLPTYSNSHSFFQPSSASHTLPIYSSSNSHFQPSVNNQRTSSNVFSTESRFVNPFFNDLLANPTSGSIPRTSHSNQQENVLSNFLITQDLVKKSIENFDGSPMLFWPWISKLADYTKTLSLTPLQILQLLETHTTGEPKKMVTQRLASTGIVSSQEVNDVYETLVRRYGSTQRITSQLLDKISEYPPIKGPNIGQQLENLHDLCKVVLYNSQHCPELKMMDFAIGLAQIRSKLPEFIQREWAKTGQHHEDSYGSHPAFSLFVDFVKNQARYHSNKNYETISHNFIQPRKPVRVFQTSINSQEDDCSKTEPNREPIKNQGKYCPYHNANSHEFVDCKAFKKLSFKDRKQFIFTSKMCYLCLGQHRAAECSSNISCTECGKRHNTLMHFNGNNGDNSPNRSGDWRRHRDDENQDVSRNSSVLCTAICRDPHASKKCTKTLLVELTMDGVPNKSIVCYCNIDEQSDDTLVDDSVVEYFGKNFPTQPYKMIFASENYQARITGRIVTGLRVRGVLSREVVKIPEALTCPNLNNTTDKVATPALVRQHPSIAHLADNFPEFEPEAKVLLLIGTSCGRALATECLHNTSEPYVHRGPLGFSLVGNACVDPDILPEKSSRVMSTSTSKQDTIKVKYDFTSKKHNFDVFQRHKDDDFPGFSSEDKQFIEIMESKTTITDEGSIQLPLPYLGIPLPDNKMAVLNRTSATTKKLIATKSKLDDCLIAMEKNLRAHYVEQVPLDELKSMNPTWYLPIFDVTHPKKRKVRLVYDASARYQGISLNDALVAGPDLINHLRGVLLRFREKPIGFTADIESMFSTFKVPKEQQDLLRFFWFEDNDPKKQLVPYRSTSHLFGCSCSPAIANFAIKYCASMHTHEEHFKLATDYLLKSFYVDDGVASVDNAITAVDTLEGAITILGAHNIRLHKITSNSQDVINQFESSELQSSSSSDQRVLGVCWNLEEDIFHIETPTESKPFTRRGILSYNNSLYDPIGFIAPLVLTGRLFQRSVLPPKKLSTKELEDCGWDHPLPARYKPEWDSWTSSLGLLNNVTIPRSFYPKSFIPVTQDLHVFCDASDHAISHVAYMRSIDADNKTVVSFVRASSKVAPRSAHSIPRLELCAAVESAMATTQIISDLKIKPKKITRYTDSNIVLGYINNTHRRFSKYVERRVSIILDHSNAEEWTYVNTSQNPADVGSRGCHTIEELLDTCWLTGPDFLTNIHHTTKIADAMIEETLPEEKKDVISMKTSVNKYSGVLQSLFSRINDWDMLISIATLIVNIIRRSDCAKQKLGKQLAPRNLDVSREDAVLFLVKYTQLEAYPDVFASLRNDRRLPENSKLTDLSPFVATDGTLRVGGRLKHADIPFQEKHPLLIPRDHPICRSIIHHVHENVKHQGCHITHGAVIAAGYHIDGGRTMIRKHIRECVRCRKLRGPPIDQFMSDLPRDRLESTAPFENVGLDVFGPFYVTSGSRTRNNAGSKKLWVVIFVCLPSRAVHLEPLEGMDTSSFRNALTRFTALRGPVKIIRSDQGTNFVSTRNQLNNIDVAALSKELATSNIQWIMNPPHGSHHGGAWERKIGSVRRVLEASFSLSSNRGLSRDEFCTFLAESAAIVNGTPLWAVSNDPNDPTPLTPAMLLTLRDTTTHSTEEFTGKDLLAYGTKRYRRIQYLANQFWIRWRRDYIQTLTKRHKWKYRTPCVEVDDIVLMRERNSPRNHWPMARVVAVKTSEDGLVRSVTLTLHKPGTDFQQRTLTRPITELVLLVPSSSHGCNPSRFETGWGGVSDQDI